MNRPTTIARRAARGFTLIEILSVLGIASVLSSIALPSFQGSLQKARRGGAAAALGYAWSARATGAPAGDAACRVLKLTLVAGSTTRSSGADDRVGNDAAANRRCWGL